MTATTTHAASAEEQPAAVAAEAAESAETATVVEQDLLVEDVSIDGMCGVY
jgi:mycofactocin precursor